MTGYVDRRPLDSRRHTRITQAQKTGAKLALSTGIPHNVNTFSSVVLTDLTVFLGRSIRTHGDDLSWASIMGLAMGRMAKLGVRVED